MAGAGEREEAGQAGPRAIGSPLCLLSYPPPTFSALIARQGTAGATVAFSLGCLLNYSCFPWRALAGARSTRGSSTQISSKPL